jgi:acyl-CoA synthetase (NDP forming)
MPDLTRLLQPKSIAVIGGGAWCASVVKQCRQMGFPGPVWPVHPTKAEIGGVSAIPRLEDMPGIPDAVFIGVNRSITIETVRLLSQMGAGGAVCFASGFREAQAETGDGESLQAALLEAAGEMPIIGPNCYGFINYLDRAALWPDVQGGAPVESGVAILTQSSNMALNITMQRRGLPLAYVATAGNQAQQGLAQIGSALLADARVTALGLHIEGIGDLPAFEALAQEARALGKPIVALKAGRSALARKAALSHTASLTGSDAGARSLLRRLGIAQVESIPTLLETLKLLHFAGPLPSADMVAMACSGGEASLIADCAETRGVHFPALEQAQIDGLRAVLGPIVALANPLDYHTFIWNDLDRMAQTFSAALETRAAIGCLIADFPRADRCDTAAWDCVFEAGARAAAGTRTPLALVATLPDAMSEDDVARAIACGMIPLMGLDEALSAIEAAAFLGQAREATGSVLPPGAPRALTTLSEAEAKAALGRHGLRVPRSARAESAAELDAALAKIGLPCVIKAEGLAHKTEAGGVVFARHDPALALTAAQAMPCDSWLVEEMIEGALAELLIGVLRDPAHGFVLTLAAGGVLTEIMADSVSLLLPVTREEVDVALDGLRIAPLLNGYRGQAPCDRAAIIDAVMAVGAYVTAHRDTLDEVEINPLICTATTAIAVDALIRIGETE